LLFRTKSSKALETAHTNGCLSTGLRSAAVVPPTIEARHTAEARRGLRVVHNTVVGMCLITGVRGFARRSLCSGSRMDLGVEAWGPLCTGHVSQCLCERSRSRSGVHSIAGVRGLRSNEERRSLWSGSRDRSWCGGLGPAVHWLCSHPGPQPALSSSSRCIERLLRRHVLDHRCPWLRSAMPLLRLTDGSWCGGLEPAVHWPCLSMPL